MSITPTLNSEETLGIRAQLNELIGLRHYARSLPHRAKQRGHHSLSGVRLAQPLGRGLEFDQVRLYQAGDDLGTMDWKVTARTNKPHVKQYRLERERPVIVVVDQRNSMFFGSRSAFKSVVAARLAALVAWLAIDNGERLGTAVITDQQLIRLPVKSGANSALRLFQTLSDLPIPQSFSKTFNLNDALRQTLPMSQTRSLLVILSDFAGINDETQSILWQWRQHSQIVAGFIYDSLEKNPPPPDIYPITDGQHDISIDLSHKNENQRYQKQFIKHFQALQQLCQECQIPLHSIATHQDIFSSPLTHWLCRMS